MKYKSVIRTERVSATSNVKSCGFDVFGIFVRPCAAQTRWSQNNKNHSLIEIQPSIDASLSDLVVKHLFGFLVSAPPLFLLHLFTKTLLDSSPQQLSVSAIARV